MFVLCSCQVLILPLLYSSTSAILNSSWTSWYLFLEELHASFPLNTWYQFPSYQCRPGCIYAFQLHLFRDISFPPCAFVSFSWIVFATDDPPQFKGCPYHFSLNRLASSFFFICPRSEPTKVANKLGCMHSPWRNVFIRELCSLELAAFETCLCYMTSSLRRWRLTDTCSLVSVWLSNWPKRSLARSWGAAQCLPHAPEQKEASTGVMKWGWLGVWGLCWQRHLTRGATTSPWAPRRGGNQWTSFSCRTGKNWKEEHWFETGFWFTVVQVR